MTGDRPRADRLLVADGDLAMLARDLEGARRSLPGRIDADPETAERGLAQLVLTLVELLRQLMERQALQRMEHGSLSDKEIDRLGETFMRLEQRMDELTAEFGLERSDLNLNLGPLGDLL